MDESSPARFDYQAPEHHVTKRDGLPFGIRETLLESTRDEWANHPRYGGMASFLLGIHRDLLNGAALAAERAQALLDTPESELRDALSASQLGPVANHLVSFAHHHHTIEDREIFPQVALIYPAMINAMALLDGDHHVLNAALDDAGTATRTLMPANPDRDQIGRIHESCLTVQAIMKRHIWDEEEIIIPIFLKHS